MNWLARLASHGSTRATIKVTGKDITVLISARANQALARRDRPIVVEIELTFACMARKRVLFHDRPRGETVFEVNGKLGLVITTVIPNACDMAAETRTTAPPAARRFLPKWVRIDYVRKEWVGEFGL